MGNWGCYPIAFTWTLFVPCKINTRCAKRLVLNTYLNGKQIKCLKTNKGQACLSTSAAFVGGLCLVAWIKLAVLEVNLCREYLASCFWAHGKNSGKLVGFLDDYCVCCPSLENFSLLKLNSLYAVLFGDTALRSCVWIVWTLVLGIQTGVRHEQDWFL